MTANPQDAQAFYDDMWKRYGHLDAVSPAAFHRRRIVVELLAKHARGAKSVLDVGCGQGELLREIEGALPGAKICGADISEQSLVDTRKRAPSYDLFQLDAAAPDFAQRYAERLGTFHALTCCEVLEHIPAHVDAAANLRSLLAPGGVAVITVPGGKMSRYDEIIGHQRHYTPALLRSLLTDAGFQVAKVLAWGFPFHNLYRTAVRIASRATMREEKPSSGASSSILGKAYEVFGRALKPLFYLNGNRFGEQLIAVVRR
jgi:trans-aconitate methyltransferase